MIWARPHYERCHINAVGVPEMKKSNLVIFDVDGTLVKSVKVDTKCFVQSIEEIFGIKDIDTRWHTYKTATDSGIFEEIFEKALARKPTASEIHMHIDKFTELLAECDKQNDGLFKEVAGANDVLAKLKSHPIWKVAIATGGWYKSTVLKLTLAGINYQQIPLVSASDEKIREDIVKRCINISKKHYETENFEKIVTVGDLQWDVKTAYNLKLGFVGINEPSVFKDIRNCLSAKDYSDFRTFLVLLERAEIPKFDSNE